MYPNPSNGFIHLAGIDRAKYVLSDLSGRVLERGTVHEEVMQLSRSYASGQYLLKIVSNKGIHTFPLMLQP